MSCPDYYMLASGREFIDFSCHELGEWLSPRVSHDVWHCIVSAMEHRYRCGSKEGEYETDKAAEEFWLDQARLRHQSHLDIKYAKNGAYGPGDYGWNAVISVVLMMVDVEKTKRWGVSK